MNIGMRDETMRAETTAKTGMSFLSVVSSPGLPPRRTGAVRRVVSRGLIPFLSLCLIPHVSSLIPILYSGAHPDWGAANVQRKVAIQSGGAMTAGLTSTDLPVWSNASQSNVTNGAVNMTAAGDGTYEYNIRLPRGATYNFLLFTRTNSSPPSGMNADSDYYDTVNASTSNVMITSGAPSAPSEPPTQVARFKQVGPTFDARRLLTVPRSMSAGSTLYVYCNFAGTPTAPVSFQATPISSYSILMSWGKPYGVWGSGGDSFAAADVIVGGVYLIRHSTGSANGPYSDLVTVPGSTFSYTRTGLTAGVTYYYIIRSSDAYQGRYGSKDIENSYSGFSSTAEAAPMQTRPVRFKVDNIDWEKVEGKFQQLVWMTPVDEDARSYPYKEQGRIVRVYVPREEEMESGKWKVESGKSEHENIYKY